MLFLWVTLIYNEFTSIEGVCYDKSQKFHEPFQITKNVMVENINQYLEKTEIEVFGGNLFLYSCLENANADSKNNVLIQ